MIPRELCDVHDVALDRSGCWVCGHGGPIEGAAAESWSRWVLDQVRDRMRRVPLAYVCA